MICQVCYAVLDRETSGLHYDWHERMNSIVLSIAAWLNSHEAP